MADKERDQRRMTRRRKVWGNASVDRADASKTAFDAEFQEFITRHVWGERTARCGARP